MENNKSCKYCINTTSNDAWKSHTTLDKEMVTSNVSVAFSDISVMVKDYGSTVSDNDTEGYKNYIKEHPASLEIKSNRAGKMIYQDNIPMIIDIEISYCPICGRRLGVNSKGT